MSIMPPEPDSKSTPPRRAISKRVRYEILRRDNNTCRYCHATDTPLTIDHVVPVALGGTDDPSNLVAACKECNAGKSSSSPDAGTVAAVSDDAARWAAAMRLAAERLTAAKSEVDEMLRPWFDTWSVHSRMGWGYRLPVDAADVLADYLAAGMPVEVLCDAARITLGRPNVDDRFRYFRGVANNMLVKLQADATAILAADESPQTYTAAEVREDKAYWRGFDEAFRISLVADAYVQARALSRVVDGENSYNRRVPAKAAV